MTGAVRGTCRTRHPRIADGHMHRALVLTGALAGALALGPEGRANEVVWTAAGTVTNVAGASFAGLALVSAPVAIELRYDEDAPREAMAISEIPGLLAHYEYRVNVDLMIRITIGAQTWEGSVATGTAGIPYTLEVQDFKIGPGTNDFFKARAAAEDGATFASFPGAPGGPRNLIELEFRSATATGAAEPDYLAAADLKCAGQAITRIATAKGAILDQLGNGIEFSIEPASIATEVPGLGEIELTGVSYDTEFDEVTVFWNAVIGRTYIVQYLDHALCWQEIISVFADETEESEFFFPAGSGVPRTQLYRVVEFE